MELYHGSATYFKQVDLTQCNRSGDFGMGFYLSTDRWHAKSAGRKKVYRSNIVYLYTFDFDTSGLRGKIFNSANIDWVKYIVNSRNYVEHEFDFVAGATADAYTNLVIRDLFPYGIKNASDKELLNLVNALNTNKFPHQYCIKTYNAINKLKFKSLERILI